MTETQGATAISRRALDPQRGLRSSDWQDRYSSSREDLVRSFYAPALAASVTYDRAAGYFRSSIYSLLQPALASFVAADGRIRLLCSPDLTADDVDSIRRGLEAREVIDAAARRELKRMLEHPLAPNAVETLANLVAVGILDIRFAVTTDGKGIFHDKVGVFTDVKGDQVSFSGSVNETWQAWHPQGNNESFEVFCSWTQDAPRVKRHTTYFQALWANEVSAVKVYAAPDAFREDLISHASDEPRCALTKPTSGQPQRRLFDHQSNGLADWNAHSQRGLLKHATGSGKTLTALFAIRDWLAAGKPALVLVPSTLLLEQWNREARAELASAQPSILLAGGGHNEWRTGGMLRLHTEQGDQPRLVIATMATAASDEFQKALSPNPNLLLVADEAHRLGAAKTRRGMAEFSESRLGLSATPERAGDSDGTRALFDYFERILDPVFTLQDAIKAKRLVPYIYEALLVQLNNHETDEWIRRTQKIRQLYAKESDQGGEISDHLKQMLIRRARIPKSAAAKIDIACNLVADKYKGGEHWLLYCSDSNQLALVMAGLRARGLSPLEYHSAMLGHQAATLDKFKRGGGVLVSIKCLDEGVDIPVISHAVILASSRNYREFVQRRGRVLRVAEGKQHAYIWDLLVLPDDRDGDEFDGLVFGEIVRAAEFARGALNATSRAQLDRLCISLGIDPDSLSDGFEDDDESEGEDGNE